MAKQINRNRTASPVPHLQVFYDVWGGLWRAQALMAAIELDLFTVIAHGNQTVPKIAAASGASEVGIQRLLDAMTAVGYLQKSRDS